eukprot:TRINITY_DN7718_c0_g1_i1.p1 TRINITY_DN7718_c0_g1~~TRINITY_DN7718_c0_g1_i1.p1  ORF type:complete len:101 (-),score=0.38 TRINITY_DN7718_c0_g1_i1:567-869(-)
MCLLFINVRYYIYMYEEFSFVGLSQKGTKKAYTFSTKFNYSVLVLQLFLHYIQIVAFGCKKVSFFKEFFYTLSQVRRFFQVQEMIQQFFQLNFGKNAWIC